MIEGSKRVTTWGWYARATQAAVVNLRVFLQLNLPCTAVIEYCYQQIAISNDELDPPEIQKTGRVAKRNTCHQILKKLYV